MSSSRGAFSFAHPRRAVLLTGLAGAGKTRLLEELSNLGEQVINLERLANHAGSVFGGLGRSPQPSHNTFQNLVCDAWLAADPQALLWLEDEGPFIGSVGLPLLLLETFGHLPVVEVQAGQDERISRLVEEYSSVAPADLETALNKLGQRLGRNLLQSAIHAIRSDRLRDAIEIVLPYYDDAYRHRMAQHHRRTLATYRPSVDEPGDLIRVVQLALQV